MKKIILLITVLSCSSIFSQDFEKLNSRDTVYLYFDKTKSFDDLHLKYLKYDFSETYSYQYPDGDAISFSVDLHKEFRKTICKKKSFIEQNKSKVFYIDDFHKSTFSKIVFLLESKKIRVYIIDAALNKRNKIYLKVAKMMNMVPTTM
ncbi:hypothetical protein NAT51_02865 [Flavobacterium amniphilum]|uniref:hypothetical protein n=1 Tax=Flavobacterium amniphilum TaxID=1834035 RepID=UPI00202A0286|nr:hypothetical protein [Flavobacterium amniphilum]MCL9804446.1 hypothetical protein [Flavobacterium amniphilum]